MYSRKLFAKHIEAGKCGAALRTGAHAATVKSVSEKQRKITKTNLAKRAKRAAVAAEVPPWDVKSIVEHKRAVEMKEKYGGRWEADDLLKDYTRETTVYKIRWVNKDGVDFPEIEDTFQAEDDFVGTSVFEDYVEQNCHGLSRYIMPTEETMQSVQERLDLGRRELMYIRPLKDARQDIHKDFERGQKVADWLQATYRSSQRLAMDQDKWRLLYLLLDAGTPGLHAGCDLLTFGRAVFYVGKGLMSRPFKHLEEAKDYQINPNAPEPTPCAERIGDIWSKGDGVIVLPVITKLCDEDIKCREAAVINLRRAGGTPCCPTPYQPGWPSSPFAHSSAAAANPTGSANEAPVSTHSAVRRTSIHQEESLGTSTSFEQVSFEECRAVQHLSDVAGTSAQGPSTSATVGAARPQNTGPEVSTTHPTPTQPQIRGGRE